MTSWLTEAQSRFVSHDQHSRERALFSDFSEFIFNIDLCSDAYELIHFKLGMMTDSKTQQFDRNLNDLDLLSRLQGYENARHGALILF